MSTKYKDLRVHEVSLVDRAANKRTFALLKSSELPVDTENGGSPPPSIEPSEDTTMTEEEIQALVSAQVQSALATQAETLELEKEEAIKKAASEAASAADSKLETELKKRDDRIARFEAVEELRKAAEFVTKAEALPGLGVDATFGPVLKSLAEACPEEFTKLEEILKRASDTINNSNLLKESGHSQESDTGALSKMDLAANALMEKDSSLSRPQAINKALENDPNLYTEYLAGGAQ